MDKVRNRCAYYITCDMIVLYFKKLVFCFTAIACAIVISALLLFILSDGNSY